MDGTATLPVRNRSEDTQVSRRRIALRGEYTTRRIRASGFRERFPRMATAIGSSSKLHDEDLGWGQDRSPPIAPRYVLSICESHEGRARPSVDGQH